MMAEEQEEEIVLFELAGLPNPDLIKGKSCYILGIGRESPTIQVGSLIYQGKYEEVIGTELLFEKLPDGSMQLIGKCNNKCQMTRLPIRYNKNTTNEESTEKQSSQTAS